jgi:hypothetical protein
MTYQDNMTLDEIAEVDLEMAKDAIRNAKRYTFYYRDHANNFVDHCLASTIERLGLKNAHKMDDKMLDMLEKTNGIKTEHRDHYKGYEKWRNGFYIFQRDVLVAFVSDVQWERSSYLMANPNPDKFFVVTNAKVD